MRHIREYINNTIISDNMEAARGLEDIMNDLLGFPDAVMPASIINRKGVDVA